MLRCQQEGRASRQRLQAANLQRKIRLLQVHHPLFLLHDSEDLYPPQALVECKQRRVAAAMTPRSSVSYPRPSPFYRRNYRRTYQTYRNF